MLSSRLTPKREPQSADQVNTGEPPTCQKELRQTSLPTARTEYIAQYPNTAGLKKCIMRGNDATVSY